MIELKCISKGCVYYQILGWPTKQLGVSFSELVPHCVLGAAADLYTVRLQQWLQTETNGSLQEGDLTGTRHLLITN